jgi:catalase
VPVRRVGRLVLDRVVDNFFAETEQVGGLKGSAQRGDEGVRL